MDKFRVIELFSGLGACSKALKNIGIDVEVVDAVEIDKYAIKSFNAIHNTFFPVQDITKWDKDYKNIDLICGGFPCQDISIAGNQAGVVKGKTRSGLMYEMLRIVGKVKPKYVIAENVKNLLSKKHIGALEEYIKEMDALGYKTKYEVMNAKDYGIPQNRPRVFIVSIRNDIKKDFIFPEKQELKIFLKDILEDKVDEKYFLSEKLIHCFSTNKGGYPRKDRFKSSIDCPVGKCITTMAGHRPTDNFVRQ